ncbi:hypothetical protein O159_26300 [Leifsonia xyli subsp. cynodontis DSM 46306]|uniref:XRE family transcriptional regulator n=1 Tax=Leifsonia xyli subsp. cynodontis DSM 46306 TaxID=1389489 RepID=U3P8D0_LEIXC|nr:hypothetical protein [Leifsonia xyli]AGW42540.1 hypothetical protein O159_26300 [Leifsonia xyli subsp. cynodontis DSM 46306]
MRKKVSDSPPGQFASKLNRYLAHLNSENGWDASGRALERATSNGRSYSYWRNLLLDERAMNATDIQMLAEVFGTTPHAFARDAVTWHDHTTTR